MTLVLVGTSYRLAPVELREKMAVAEQRAGDLARQLAVVSGHEAVCLSTCNRTELYVVSYDAQEGERDAITLLAELAELSPGELLPSLYRLHDEAAALHLFRVAAGLDSLVPGEAEILGQVRAAAEVGFPGSVLDRLFRQALHAGKKARSETAIGESPASVSSAAVVLAEQVFGDLASSSVLLVGAGKVGELAARNLASRGARIAYVASRRAERAADVAHQYRAEPIELDRLAPVLPEVDVVVSSTRSSGVVLDRRDVEGAQRARKGRPLFLIDLAVPRDLDAAINDLEGCYLYDIDDLEAVVAETLAGRRREAERAESIVVAEADRFREWQASLEVVPAIASLRALAEEIRAGELAKAEGRLARLSEGDRRVVESVTTAIVNKLLHLPTVRMKEAAAAADGSTYVDAVRHLFGLGDDDSPENRVARK
jgi:glutamyl-tRNA reductase